MTTKKGRQKIGENKFRSSRKLLTRACAGTANNVIHCRIITDYLCISFNVSNTGCSRQNTHVLNYFQAWQIAKLQHDNSPSGVTLSLRGQPDKLNRHTKIIISLQCVKSKKLHYRSLKFCHIIVALTGAVLNRIFIFVVSSPSIYGRC